MGQQSGPSLGSTGITYPKAGLPRLGSTGITYPKYGLPPSHPLAPAPKPGVIGNLSASDSENTTTQNSKRPNSLLMASFGEYLPNHGNIHPAMPILYIGFTLYSVCQRQSGSDTLHSMRHALE